MNQQLFSTNNKSNKHSRVCQCTLLKKRVRKCISDSACCLGYNMAGDTTMQIDGENKNEFEKM